MDTTNHSDLADIYKAPNTTIEEYKFYLCEHTIHRYRHMVCHKTCIKKLQQGWWSDSSSTVPAW
jgi:hypothetical protein